MAKKKFKTSVTECNLTPMIDVTFQLIIFFILVGQITSEDLKPLIPPMPYDSLANQDASTKFNIIVNVPSEAGDDLKYVVDSEAKAVATHRAEMWFVSGEEVELDNDEALKDALVLRLAKFGEDQAEACVEIRCDRRVYYENVERVLLAAGKAGISKMNITALVDD